MSTHAVALVEATEEDEKTVENTEECVVVSWQW